MADPIVEGRLRRLIGALRREGPLHIAEVLLQHRRRRRWAEREEGLPDLDRFLPTPAGSADPLTGLADRALALISPWLADRDRTARTLDRLDGRERAALLDDADRIASGRFTLLGISIVEPNGGFDWHRDYTSGKVWPLDRFDRIAFLSGDGADVKVPWELSRMTWIGTLGFAHTIDPERPLPSTGETPREVFGRLLSDWSGMNPYGFGVNWAMPMEVALRSFWLVAGLALFGERIGPEEQEWWRDYLRLLAGHGRSLYHTLEYLPNLTNHYIADCFGLLVAGALFDRAPEARRWFESGKRRLERELVRQVTADGFHYERSIPYHGLVLELYLVAALLAERAGSPFSERSLETIDRMAAFSGAVTPSPGTAPPLLGDADDGRLLRLHGGVDLYDQTPLLEIHGALRGRPTAGSTTPLLLLCGATDSSGSVKSDRGSRHFEEGGIVVLQNEQATLILDVGPIGLHGNNDTLSFALYGADGTPWIIDPGTPCYTGDPALRNLFRSTAAHNTVMVDRREIAEFAGLWRVREDRTATEVLVFDPDANLVRARHHAYRERDRGGVIHEREIRLEQNGVRIVDRLIGDGTHRLSSRWTLDPEVAVASEGDLLLLRRPSAASPGTTLSIASSITMTVAEGATAPSYGLLVPTTTLAFSLERTVPFEIEYLCRFRPESREEE